MINNKPNQTLISVYFEKSYQTSELKKILEQDKIESLALLLNSSAFRDT